jgi:hypothetical protein
MELVMRGLRVWVVMGAVVLGAGVARAATPDAVDDAYNKLKGEADELFQDKAEEDASWVRPRPAVKDVDPALYARVLQELATKHTGDPAKDAYVRYHMMYVVNRALAKLDKPIDRMLVGRLVREIPEAIPYKARPWYVFDPPEIGKKHEAMIDSCVVRVGFPPFYRWVYPPESFQYMNGAARAKAEATYKEALALEGKFKKVPSKSGGAYNNRMEYANWALKEYRGELYYASLIDQPGALDDLTRAIGAAAGSNPDRATDLATVVNAAYFNGILGGYNKSVMKAAEAKLKAACATYERTVPKNTAKNGETVIGPAWDRSNGRWRNLSEALFTVITAIDTDNLPRPMAMDSWSRPAPPPAPAAKPAKDAKAAEEDKPAFKAETVTVADIDAAIAKALPALEKLRPPDLDYGYLSYHVLGMRYWREEWHPGQSALSTWAMLAAGEPYKAPWMLRRAGWVLCFDDASTYDRAMRLQMMTMVPPSEKKAIVPWVKRDAKWMVDTMTEAGGWEQSNTGVRTQAIGDNANSQYAMLGLWGASQAGFEVPDAAWAKIDKYWREGQRPPGAPGAGAWAVIPSSALKKGANLNAFSNQVSAAMTAGGVLSLYITESFLYGEKRAEVGGGTLSPELLRGVDWLDHNFSLEKLDGDSDFYYYAWTIQNVGQATGYRTFNKIDWFREATAMLLNKQGKDGVWDGPKGKNVSSSFALLYLCQARGPLAICKLKIEPEDGKAGARQGGAEAGGAWNNRPNDLYNFTRDISKRAEVPTSWQIADLDQPVYQLIESPILYLATSQPFKLSAKHVSRLKEYLAAGGMLVCVPEGKSTMPVVASMKALAEEVAPGSEGKRRDGGKDETHPFYNLFATVDKPLPTITYAGKLRPLVVIVEKDIGRDLQMNKTAERAAFDLLDNIYLYATGRNAKRPRIATNFVTQHNMAPKTKLAVARIKYAGDFDPEPLAMGQLKAIMADDHNVDLKVSVVGPAGLTKEMKVAFLTVSEGMSMTDEELASLKKWVDDGGTLWVDAAGGSVAAVDKEQEILPKVGMTDIASLERTAIFTGAGLTGGKDVGEPEVRRFFNARSDRAALKGKMTGQHPSVVALNGDLSAGWAGMNHWGIAGYAAPTARQVVVNGLLLVVKENAPPATAPATRAATQPATKQAK